MLVKLKVLLGKSTGKEIDIPVPRFLIGRSDECHLRPKSESVSRNHCVILTHEDKVTVRDLNSRNGTFVNGKRVEGDVELNDGDALQVGKLEFQLAIEATAAAATSDASSAEKPPKSEKRSSADDSTVGVSKKPSEDTSSPKKSDKPSRESKSGVAADVSKATLAMDSVSNPSANAGSPVAKAPRPDDSSTEFDVSAWLEEADKVDQVRRRSDPETRQFKLEESDRAKLEEAKDETDKDAVPKDSGSGEKAKGPPDKKQAPGKLPTRPNSTNSSREAAEEALKKFFRSR